jgi:predicted dehydrogenase
VAAPLRAVVVGAGFAGEGHTTAMRYAGVEVVAICARQPDVVRAVAGRLEIAQASTDWHATLERERPDVVCIGTPGGVRDEVIDTAARIGAHVYCDKPLATNAAQARRLFDVVERAGVKHAYAVTHHYDPSVRWIADLVRDGAIGTLREIEGTFRRHLPPLTPFTWYDTVATGGGLLSNAFPHWLAILHTLAGGEMERVMGEARVLRHRAPVVEGLHDFRDRAKATPTPAAAERLEWRACDAENAFSALLRFKAADANTVAGDGKAEPVGGVEPAGAGREVAVSLSVSGALAAWPPNGWRLHGDAGSLIAEGQYSYAVFRQAKPGAEREPLPVPPAYSAALPRAGDEFQNKWAALARQFIADVRGEPHEQYFTFRDGWRFQEAIEAIRSGRGWYAVPG